MEGWIKLYRKILDNPIITKDSDFLAVWVYLLLNATHKEYDAVFRGQRITLKRGQLLTGRKSISEKLKIDENKVQRILKSLENEHQIEQQKSNKNRLITIVLWDKYQQDEQQNEQQVNNKRTTTEQQVNTNKNVKNIKNDKNIITTVSGSRVDDLQENNENDSRVDSFQRIIEFYNRNVGAITPFGAEVISDYLKDMPEELIMLAMKKAVEADARSIRYIKGILNNWHKKGIKTVLEAEKENAELKKKNEQKAPPIEQREYSEAELSKFYTNVKE